MKKELIISKLVFLLGFWLASPGFAQTESTGKIKIIRNIFYRNNQNQTGYEKKRCFLDLYLPRNQTNFPALVWFHGGSMKRGSKDDPFTKNLAASFAGDGVAIAVVNYRLSPETKYPGYLKDAAAAVAWTKNSIVKYGGNVNNIFIGGHSAGAYLTLMLGFDNKFLQGEGLKTSAIRGLIPLGAQTLTHYTVREERGVPNPHLTPVIDDASPCTYITDKAPPVLAICGDGDSPDRKGENRLFIALLKKAGHQQARYREITNRNHWELVLKLSDPEDPLREIIITFIRGISNQT